jgi:hypothetical protein
MAHILEQHLAKALGIELLSLSEQSSFLSEVGDRIFETALVRLYETLDANEQSSLEEFLAAQPEPDAVLAHILHTHPHFETILQGVVFELKDEAQGGPQDAVPDVSVVD